MLNKDTLSLSRLENNLSIEKAVNGTTLGSLVVDVGEPSAVKAIAQYLKICSEYFNTQNNITTDQAIIISSQLLYMHPLLTIEDVMLAMKEARACVEGYEKVYGRIDGSMIFSWINTYMDRKLDYEEAVRNRQKQEEHNDWAEAGRQIFSKLDLTLFTHKNSGSQVQTRSKLPNGTFEKLVQNIKNEAKNFTKKQIQAMIKDLSMKSGWGAFDEVIDFLKNELKSRKTNVPTDNGGEGGKRSGEEVGTLPGQNNNTERISIPESLSKVNAEKIQGQYDHH